MKAIADEGLNWDASRVSRTLGGFTHAHITVQEEAGCQSFSAETQ